MPPSPYQNSLCIRNHLNTCTVTTLETNPDNCIWLGEGVCPQAKPGLLCGLAVNQTFTNWCRNLLNIFPQTSGKICARPSSHHLGQNEPEYMHKQIVGEWGGGLGLKSGPTLHMHMPGNNGPTTNHNLLLHSYLAYFFLDALVCYNNLQLPNVHLYITL